MSTADIVQAQFQRVRAFFDALTSPPPSLTDLYERRQVRVMATLLVVMIALIVVFGTDWLLSSSVEIIVPVIVFGSLGLCIALYIINRRGNYRAACWALVGLVIATSYILYLYQPTDMLSLTYQVIAMLIVGVFMPVRTTVAVAIAVIIGTILLPTFVSLPLERDFVATGQQTVIVLVVVTLLSAWHREHVNLLRRQEVKQSEKRYRVISELLSDFACAFDATEADPRLEWITDAFYTVTGYTAAEARRVSDWDAKIYPEDLLRLRDQRRRMYRGQPSGVEEFRFRHKDGHTIWLTNRLYPEWKDGRVVRVYCAYSDITEQKRLKEEVSEKELLRAQLTREQEMAESRNKFMSLMSHELRTPLAVILSTSELLDKYHERLSEARRHELLERIISQVTQLAGTMEDLSMLVQVQSGRLRVRLEATDLAALVQRWVSDMRASVGAEHTFDFSVEGDLSAVPVDERLLTIVVNNLLSNAVKYSQPGTAITVRLRRDHGRVTLKIADQGIGIPEDDLQKLYQPYFRASNVGTIVGTGLGLRTVKEFVELHDGTITLDSAVGVGTTVTIDLPLPPVE